MLTGYKECACYVFLRGEGHFKGKFTESIFVCVVRLCIGEGSHALLTYQDISVFESEIVPV